MAPATLHLQDRRPSRPPNPENIRKRAAAKPKTKNRHNHPQVCPPSPARRQPESESEEENAEDEAYVEPAPANQIRIQSGQIRMEGRQYTVVGIPMVSKSTTNTRRPTQRHNKEHVLLDWRLPFLTNSSEIGGVVGETPDQGKPTKEAQKGRGTQKSEHLGFLERYSSLLTTEKVSLDDNITDRW